VTTHKRRRRKPPAEAPRWRHVDKTVLHKTVRREWRPAAEAIATFAIGGYEDGRFPSAVFAAREAGR
jgi:hypothetical protein